jgi:hypothetical protein
MEVYSCSTRDLLFSINMVKQDAYESRENKTRILND